MLRHTVVVLTRNHSRHIDDCLDSLARQTLAPDEIILADTGSSDDTVTRAQAHPLAPAAVIPPPGATTSCAREAAAFEAAVDRTRGRLVLLLSGCDRFKPNKIAEYARAFAQRPDASAIQAPLELVDDEGRRVGSEFVPAYHVDNHLAEIYRRHDVKLFYPTSSLAFPRHYVRRVLPLELTDGAPLGVAARLCLTAPYFGTVVTLPDPLTDRRCCGREEGRGMVSWREALWQARVFNRFCRRHGLRPIAPWRNVRLYGRVLTDLLPPAARRIRGNDVPPNRSP